MSKAGWNCDIDVNITHVNSQKDIVSKSIASTDLLPAPNVCSALSDTNTNHANQSGVLQEQNLKRARLSLDPATQPLTNGFVNTRDGLQTVLWPLPPDLMQTFRCTFDAKFRSALQQNLGTYLSRLKSVEEATTSLRSTFEELRQRMDCIEHASNDLKQMLREQRGTLPAPTAGVGQRRTISSQAPRLPSSGPPTISSELSSVLEPTIQQALVTVDRSEPPTCIANHIQSAVRPSITAAISSTLPTSTTSSTAPVPNVSSTLPVKVPLSVRPMDMIDLTADASPTVSVTVDEFLPILPPCLPRQNVVERCLALNSQRTNPSGPITSKSTANSCQSTNSVIAHVPTTASRIAWFAPPTMGIKQRPPLLLQFHKLSCHELQQLPVAPLPPIPLQTSNQCPIQPMPQLTIAEAAEGVCLQWTVTYQSLMFEAATAYEIYSYASSELTAETLYTCLPWKKVGEVAALPLPMACTLTHVQSSNMYYFIVRSIDRFRRYSAWSNVVNAYVG
ncbi:hypothetical protein EG68_09727 [Paragonimus skrjabini miyazakii]|uniref:Activating transcription factor 7-interacting protein Fn3 domain-containing protein n=1 Tax=Paragonimus skrjabini miyazakii TaxID=59628 RepID=A0A8S9YTD9_9TREM|nr:hypothetical protein EG68_09727 [Paragonimus skrjabini miyazakii]